MDWFFFSSNWIFFSVLMDTSKNQWRSTGGNRAYECHLKSSHTKPETAQSNLLQWWSKSLATPTLSCLVKDCLCVLAKMMCNKQVGKQPAGCLLGCSFFYYGKNETAKIYPFGKEKCFRHLKWENFRHFLNFIWQRISLTYYPTL